MKKKLLKTFAVFVVGTMLWELSFPVVAYALTGGPSQPEVQSFEPIGTSEMVNLFSGDFVYNIPLLDVEGYPVNLSYHSGIGMDQEASWVGLGWNINPGVVNRNMRGVPDDFSGESVKKELNMKENETYGINVGMGFELFGYKKKKGQTKKTKAKLKKKLSFSFGIFYNNYKGMGYEFKVDPSISSGDKSKGKFTGKLGLSANSQKGIDVKPNLSYSHTINKNENNENSLSLSASVGAPYNSRAGLKALTYSAGYNVTRENAKHSGTDEEQTQNRDKDGKRIVKSKDRKARRSFSGGNGGSLISFGSKSYVPNAGPQMENSMVMFNATVGLEAWGVHPNFSLGGYKSTQSLREKTQELAAFGYMYAEDANNADNVILDFNREKDGGYSENTPNLPITNFTYDIYSVNGQGIGGMYRPFRGDMGTVYDSKSTTTNKDGSLGLEIGTANIVHGGADLAGNFAKTETGKWEKDNRAAERLQFKGKADLDDPFYEPYYFKNAGEKATIDEEFYNKMGGDEPIRIGLDKTTFRTKTLTNFVKGNEDEDNGYNPIQISDAQHGNVKQVREKRNNLIAAAPANEAQITGLDKVIRSYNEGAIIDANGDIASTVIDRLSVNKNQKHISELTATNPDGSRYVYGIPAFNTFQKEVSFSVSPASDPCADFINYDANDNSTSNSKGLDNYYSSTELPPFAHSYLLTGVLSADYVDVTGDGITDDDLGNATKINYTRVHGGEAPFRWRIPSTDQNREANYNPGLKTDKKDDKANYIYGEKEIWYMHSIVTKNYIAEFKLSDTRTDGLGVQGENGLIDTGRKLRMLESISLYSKHDRMENGANAVPIKVVHFEYSNELCGDIGNSSNNAGKLTLKKIYFTYGKSKKGQLSPYKFIYGDTNHDGTPDAGYNPDYDMKAYDRWGNYKPKASCGNLSNSDFPYVAQESKAQADQNATAWHLTTIELPSGGTIKVSYESDDYAYVQDKRAMQMFKITGWGPNYNSNNDIDNNSAESDNNRIYFKLSEPINGSNPAGDAQKLFEDQYFKGVKNLYFRCLMELKGGDKDYVSGYAEIINKGVVKSSGGDYDYGWVKMKKVDIDDKNNSDKCHPVAKASWQFIRLHLPKLLYPAVNTNGGVDLIVKSLIGFGNDIKNIFKGPNKNMRDQGYAKKVVMDKSWIRLNNPTKKKFGGGARVSKIVLSDNWAEMLSGQSGYLSTDYGQEYTYTTTEKNALGVEVEISSGVAAYEPMLGNDENPWRQPKGFSVEHFLAPDDDYYLETPFGEGFFPAPTVGYSKVKVSNLQYSNVKRTATGYVVNEFFTAKDFPTITKQTSLKPIRKKPNPIFSLLKIGAKDYMTTSQGYVVELNDMHGKPKATWVYAENQEEPIAGLTHHYLTDPTNDKHLDNTVYTIQHDGTISKSQVGIDFDFVFDTREQVSETNGGSAQVNLELFFPGVSGMVWPGFTNEATGYRSAVVTKVINRYGILQKTVAYDNGAAITTENIAYDAETGELLISKSQNEYEDDLFSFTYPAHWAYDGMGQAYRNAGVEVAGNVSNPKDYFVLGDEVIHDGKQAWVFGFNPMLVLVDRNGLPYTTSSNVKVIRSGRKNQQVASVGQLTLKQNPLKDNNSDGTYDDLTFTEVLSASATEYDDNWNIFCNCGLERGQVVNPYIIGKKGMWRPVRDFSFIADRTQTMPNTNIREDGTFTTFSSFWDKPYTSGDPWPRNVTGWTSTSEVTIYSPYGQELENKDALNRYSAAVFGYNNTLPKLVASNAERIEVAFDGFEDYDLTECDDDHFSFKQTHAVNVTSDESHTGRKSIKVGPGGKVEVLKALQECQ